MPNFMLNYCPRGVLNKYLKLLMEQLLISTPPSEWRRLVWCKEKMWGTRTRGHLGHHRKQRRESGHRWDRYFGFFVDWALPGMSHQLLFHAVLWQGFGDIPRIRFSDLILWFMKDLNTVAPIYLSRIGQTVEHQNPSQHSMNLLPLSYLRLQADSTDEAPWQWANGANFTYANWGAGEPSGGTEDCAHMQSGTFSIRKKTRMSCCQRISLRNSEDCLIHAK